MECFRGPGTVLDVDTMNTLYTLSTESLQPSGKLTLTLYLHTGVVNSQPNVQATQAVPTKAQRAQKA